MVFFSEDDRDIMPRCILFSDQLCHGLQEGGLVGGILGKLFLIFACQVFRTIFLNIAPPHNH